MRYDAAIIGAGANGLTAAATLARAGLNVVVLERGAYAGGRLTTLEFHPGHFASPYTDLVPEIPAAIARAFEIEARTVTELPAPLRATRDAALARAFTDAAQAPSQGLLKRWPASAEEVWSGEALATAPLVAWPDMSEMANLGRALDAELAGSALALMALPVSEAVAGGLGVLGEAFARAAQTAGAELRLGQEAVEVVIAQGRAGGVALADGSRVMAGAVISTLDLKQSLLTLFPWAALPGPMLEEARAWRMGGGAARLLLAFARPLRRQTILCLDGGREARTAFRHGAVPEAPSLWLNPVSHRDRSLTPEGAATATITLAPIPYKLFDGGWTTEKRAALAARALARIEKAVPGTLASLLAVKILAPPDIENGLAATAGDLDGGALAPDQMLSLRPPPRTQLAGFYLGGRSAQAGPLGTGAAGFAAAAALMADITT